jgi:hypothetical protein
VQLSRFQDALKSTKTSDIFAGARLRYFLSNKNTGWLTTARSNSSREESAVTPK